MAINGELLTFEEYRHVHEEALRRQRESLENEGIADAILAEGGSMGGWIPWENAFAPAS